MRYIGSIFHDQFIMSDGLVMGDIKVLETIETHRSHLLMIKTSVRK